MMSVGNGICRNCGSVNVEHMDGFAFYATLCFFCGNLYSKDTLVVDDDDYHYEAMSSRQIPEYKDSYEAVVTEREGKGVAFFAAKNNKTITSKYITDEYVGCHESSEEYGNGEILVKENEPDSWYEDMIKEIETNSDINKDKSYVTRFDKKLILLYGDEEIFAEEIREIEIDYTESEKGFPTLNMDDDDIPF